MVAVKGQDVRNNFKAICERVFGGETLIISRPKNENIVMISEQKYEEMEKAKRNADYVEMIRHSRKQIEAGDTISFTMDELRAMESDDWKPSNKVLDWMEKKRDE